MLDSFKRHQLQAGIGQLGAQALGPDERIVALIFAGAGPRAKGPRDHVIDGVEYQYTARTQHAADLLIETDAIGALEVPHEAERVDQIELRSKRQLDRIA